MIINATAISEGIFKVANKKGPQFLRLQALQIKAEL